MNRALIVSLKPLEPVKSGFQNTVFLLAQELKKHFDLIFVYNKNENLIDPVFDLSHSNEFEQKLKNVIREFSPDYIFINTTKLFHIYKDIFVYSQSRLVLICHDLYFFRSQYFKAIEQQDRTPLKKKDEIDTLKFADYIIDFSPEEKTYLIENKIDQRKLVETMTPISIIEYDYDNDNDRTFDYFFIGSKWSQNSSSINFFFKNYKSFFSSKMILIIGLESPIKSNNFVSFDSLRKDHYKYAKIGLAPIFFGTGRNVKIFDMMANGLPVITNKDLSKYGLKSGTEYMLVNSSDSWASSLHSLETNNEKRRALSFNGWKWVKDNCSCKVVFETLIRKLKSEL